MTLLRTISREEASGNIAQTYQFMEEKIGLIPNVVKMHSASPEFFEKFMSVVGHFTNHPTLDAVLVSYIRMLISNRENAAYCVRLQSAVLFNYKISKEEIASACEDYHQVKLEPKRKEILVFVMDLIFGEIRDAKTGINKLKDLGWSEKDIYEAAMLGAIQKGVVQLIKAFEVQQDF